MLTVLVLGTAAGGGVPQWNCACAQCTAARDGRIAARLQASIAVTGGDGRWLIVNATSDIRRQIESDPRLTPRAPRRSPVDVVLLTDANLDHSAGLLDLRQAGELRLYSTERVRSTLAGANPVFAQFAREPRVWTDIAVGEDWRPVDATGIPFPFLVRAIEASGTLPSFAGGRRAPGAAVAFAFIAGDAIVVYAPIIGEPSPTLLAAIDTADAAFIDGTFFTDAELPAQHLGARTARGMGHQPMSGPSGSLAWACGMRPRRRYFTHINNSNPALMAESDAARCVRDAGWTIADDGLELTLANGARIHG